MERKQHIDAFGAAVLIVFSAMLGLNQVLIKIVNAGLQPVFQAGLRSVCAFFPVLLFAYVARKRLSLTNGSLGPGILCGTFFGIEFILLFQALDYTTVARASVMFYTMPVWVAAAAHFLIPGEKLTVTRSFGLVLAVAGVAWALAVDERPASNLAFIGDLMCLAAALLWAGIALLARTTRLSKSSPEMQLLYQLGVSAPILLVVALMIGGPIREPTALIWGIFAFQVLVVVCVGFLTWFWILSIYPASSMTSFSFLSPVFGVLFGWLILDEHISVSIIGGLVLVSAGIVLVNRK